MIEGYEIVKWQESKYLVVSSMFFLPTSYLSYIKHYYLYSLLMSFVVFCSMNYWRKATYGKRRQIDLLISKIGFFVYLYNGIINLQGITLLISYPTSFGMLYCFYTANQCFTNNNNNWLRYHCMFHLLAGLQSYIITCYLPEIEYNKN
jgi:hypothetical protein